MPKTAMHGNARSAADAVSTNRSIILTIDYLNNRLIAYNRLIAAAQLVIYVKRGMHFLKQEIF